MAGPRYADGAFIEINTVEFEAAMQRLRAGIREGLIDPAQGALPVQARLLAEECQILTPPISQNGLTPRATGERAVRRDIRRAFYPIDSSTFRTKRLRAIVQNDNRGAWYVVAQRMTKPELAKTQAIAFSESWHRSNRVSRGRMRQGTARSGGKNLGFVTLGAQTNRVKEYMKKIVGRVGWARAGWNMGILLFGGKTPAAWISRHGVSGGSASFQSSGENPYVRVSNNTKWAQYNHQEGNRIVANAIASRAQHMQTYVTKMMSEKVAAATRAGQASGKIQWGGIAV